MIDSNIHANTNYYFQTIKNTGMVKNAKEGFEKVLADEDGTFAFIHEASQVCVYQLHGSGLYLMHIRLEHHQRYLIYLDQIRILQQLQFHGGWGSICRAALCCGCPAR